ncbi:MAG: hypothetical protein ACI81R_000074 [Bradymonadia bacterium]|jgi:hypothetical protein
MQSVGGELLTRHEPLVALSGQLTAAQESLTSLPSAVTQLTIEVPGLASNAISAFRGPNAINAPRVLENVGIAIGQLEALPATSRAQGGRWRRSPAARTRSICESPLAV